MRSFDDDRRRAGATDDDRPRARHPPHELDEPPAPGGVGRPRNPTASRPRMSPSAAEKNKPCGLEAAVTVLASSQWQSSMSDRRQFPREVVVLTFGEHARHLFSPSRVQVLS